MKQILALIYDQWRHTRWFFLTALGFGVFFCVVFCMDPRSDAQGLKVLIDELKPILGMVHISWVIVLLILSGDFSDIRLTLPRYVTRLPVSSWKIVCARMAYGIATNLILAVTFTGILYTVFDARLEQEIPFQTYPIIWSMDFVLLQATAWCIGPFGFVATIGAMGSVAWLSHRLFGFDGATIREYSAAEISGIILVSLIASTVSIHQSRKGRLNDFSWRNLLPANTSKEGADLSNTFASKKEALKWLHYREVTNFVPKLVVVHSVLCFLMFSNIDWDGRSWQVSLAVGLYVGVNAAMIAIGLVALLRGWGPLLKKDGAFLLTRPVTTMELITARWEANRRAVLQTVPPFIVCAAILFLASPLVVYSGGSGSEVETTFTYLSFQLLSFRKIFLCAAAILSMCVIMWAMLSLENIIGFSIIGGVVAIVVASIWGLFWNPASPAVEDFGFVTTAILIWATLIALYANLKRKNLLNTQYLLTALALIPVIGVGVMLATQANALVGDYPPDTMDLATAMAFVVPIVIAPIITGPLLMDWVRHKR